MTLLTLNPTDDTYLESYHTGSNFGSTDPLLIGAGDVSNGGALYHALLRFDLSSAPDPTVYTINSVTLTLVNAGHGAGLTVGTSNPFVCMRMKRNTWTEAGATWTTYDGTHNWGSAGANGLSNDISNTHLVSSNMPSTPANLVFAITSALYADLFSFMGPVALRISKNSEAGTNDYLAVYSREDGTPANWPALVIDYTLPPPPGPPPGSSPGEIELGTVAGL